MMFPEQLVVSTRYPSFSYPQLPAQPGELTSTPPPTAPTVHLVRQTTTRHLFPSLQNMLHLSLSCVLATLQARAELEDHAKTDNFTPLLLGTHKKEYDRLNITPLATHLGLTDCQMQELAAK